MTSSAAAPPAETITVLVLGPMRQVKDGAVTVEDRTAGLKVLLERIREDLEQDAIRANRKLVVTDPADKPSSAIVHGVLDLVESADLVILDLTDSRPSVTYEAGIVHALGLPSIVITSDAEPPFYFRGADYIGEFHYARAYDPDNQVTHRDLRDKIRRFIADSTLFSRNQITDYFELPIVDIAGPSGLAAGYFRNSIRRFLRRQGFVGSEREVVWSGRLEVRDGVEMRRPETRQMTIGQFIAVRPPGSLRHSDGHADQLNATLKALGLRIEFATIRKRAGDFADMRDYGGQFLAYDTPRDEPVEFIQPGVIVEIPTTLYALPFSPRVEKRLRLSPDDPDAEERLLRHMQASFERTLAFLLHRDREIENRRPFRWANLEELPALLAPFARR